MWFQLGDFNEIEDNASHNYSPFSFVETQAESFPGQNAVSLD